MRSASSAYVPRRPHETILYGLVREHYETFVAYTQATYSAPLPHYVTDTFERYLTCGDFSQGFVRCHCDGCGHDVLVAFSCKGRGLCPSCNGRRMCAEAAELVDRVLPNAPLRQWVLSLPFELRGLAALKPDVLTALGRIFAEEIARVTRRLADIAGTETGAISFPQRFGGSLNLHVHFHALAVDGVFEKVDDAVRVHETPPPSKADLDDAARRVHNRVLRWLRRHGYVDERSAEERSNEPSATTPIDGLAALALAGGTFLAQPFATDDADSEPLDRKERRFSASCNGFDIHCAVRIAADDDEGRERLVRYCARPAFALDRIGVLPDGRVTYRMKVSRKGRTHRVMTPVEFLARLAILIPPPYFPLVRYHGVFAARSSWRALVTPKPPSKKPASCTSASSPAPLTSSTPALDAPMTTPPPASPSPCPAPTPIGPCLAQTPVPTVQPTTISVQPPVAAVDPTTISVSHWGRLLDGELFTASSRIDWAVLLRRTFGFDALRCPKCDQKMRILATITDATSVRRFLEHLGVRADPLPRGPARDPTGQLDLRFDAA